MVIGNPLQPVRPLDRFLDDQTRMLGVPRAVVNVPPDVALQGLRRCLLNRRIGRWNLPCQALEQVGRTSTPELLLAAEVIADHRVVDPYPFGDFAQAHRRETPGRKKIQRRLQDLRPRLLAALLLGYSWRAHPSASTDP
ncbi:hypothetical protein D3C85_1547250 [compost metagenome]